MHLAFKSVFFAHVAALLVAAAPAAASTLLTVSSYDLPNGDGTAAGGDFNYWDSAYNNCLASNYTTDGLAGSYLSGGLGKLTGGFIPTNSFFGGDGVGANVGWLKNPTIAFHFGSAQAVNKIKLFVDNSAISDVAAPSLVLFDGTPYTDASWGSVDVPQTIDITGLAINSSDITVLLDRSFAPGIYWVFLSEAQFFGPSPGATPLPAAWSMMLIGMAGLGFATWRRRKMLRLAPA